MGEVIVITSGKGGVGKTTTDDLFVTNVKRLSCGIRLEAANAILVKVNQIGTLKEAPQNLQHTLWKL